MTNIQEPLVRIENITKTFTEGGQTRTVLHAVNTSFARGEFVVLLGKSGSGKSTLLNLLGGIDQPSSGTITIDSINLTKQDEQARTLFRRKHIGFIFQFYNLLPTLTVLENVLLPVELNHRLTPKDRQYALDLLDQVGLADRRDTYPDRLSGGEQQRIALARALVHDPLLILADEPTGNLDAETGTTVLHLLDTLTRRAGKNLIMATHSADVLDMADRVFRIEEGQLHERMKDAGGRMHKAQSTEDEMSLLTELITNP